MTISRHFRFFVTLFILAAISNTHPLYAMQQEPKKASDFQIYQLLSEMKENESLLLPTEIIQKITIDAYLIMESKLNHHERWIRSILKNHYDIFFIPLEHSLSENCENDSSWCP